VKVHISGVAIALALFAGSARAADLPSTKVPPPIYVAPPAMWTGFYAGLNAGASWGATTNATTVSAPLLDNVAFQANKLDPLRYRQPHLFVHWQYGAVGAFA
jgi:outer membrane immunogenic protein